MSQQPDLSLLTHHLLLCLTCSIVADFICFLFFQFGSKSFVISSTSIAAVNICYCLDLMIVKHLCKIFKGISIFIRIIEMMATTTTIQTFSKCRTLLAPLI